MTYNDFINDILVSRGRFGIPKGEYKERHHIIPRCTGGLDEEDNLIDLTAKEHFIAHMLLAKENITNESLVYAWHMMCTCGKGTNERYEVSPEEYEEAKIHWLPFQQVISSTSNVGRKWFTDGYNEIFSFSCPEGWYAGRKDSLKETTRKSKLNNKYNKGKHWYNNGFINVYTFECPDGFIKGTLPMTDDAKLAHSVSMKGNPKLKNKKKNRWYETLIEVEKRINIDEFSYDFLFNNLTDDDLSLKYHITSRMSQKLRRKHKLFMKVRVNYEN